MYSKFDEAVSIVQSVDNIIHLMEIALYYTNSDTKEIDYADVSSACEILHKVLNNAAEVLVDAEHYKKIPAKER